MNHFTKEGTWAFISRMARPVWVTSRGIKVGRASVRRRAILSRVSARVWRGAFDQIPDLKAACAVWMAVLTSSVEAEWTLWLRSVWSGGVSERNVLREALACCWVFDGYSWRMLA